MAKKGTKRVREKGKISLSRYFQEFEKGDTVAIVREPAVQSSFPERMQGRTGTIQDKRGRFYIVKIKDGNKEKMYLVEPIHLKRIGTQKLNVKTA
ncbi:MAG: 50S ribosomal protein L21e [Candidatus Pacearchaeota archaeon]